MAFDTDNSDSYHDTLEPVIRRGLPAILAIARTARSRLLRVARSMPGRSRAEIVRRTRVELARIEPTLARAITDSMLAAWLSAARPVAKDAISSPSVIDPHSQHSSDRPRLALPGGVSPPGRRPPRPPSTGYYPDDDGEPAPVVKFPANAAALRDLTRREILLPGDYDAIGDEAKSAAFTVAKAVSKDAVQKVRDALVDDVRTGGTLREFRAATADAIGGTLNESQVETLYRTQVGQAHGAGLREVLEHPLVSDEFPFVAYIATHDDRVRLDHIALETLGINGTNVYWRDDPVIQRFWAPWAWNCFTPGTEVQGRFLFATRMRYSGDAIKIMTRSGNTLSVTANHPILTPNGFAAAKSLRKGGNVLSYSRGIKFGLNTNDRAKSPSIVSSLANDSAITSPCQNEQNQPMIAEEVFSSLAKMSGVVRMPVGPNDFHADASFGNGDIEVVSVNRKLLLSLKSALSQSRGNLALTGVDSDFSPVSRDGDFLSVLGGVSAATDGKPSLLALPGHGAGVSLDSRPLDPFLVGLASDIDASRFEMASQSQSNQPGPIANAFDGLSGQVGDDQFLNIGDAHTKNAGPGFSNGVGLGLASQFNGCSPESPCHGPFTDAKFAAQMANGFPGVIEADEIIDIVNFQWSGHVYDFQTTGGWLVSNHILSSNCRCVMVPYTVEDAARAGVMEAKRWLASGKPPAKRTFVRKPEFDLPRGWPRGGGIQSIL